MKIHLIAPSGACTNLRSPELALQWFHRQGISFSNGDCFKRVNERFAGTDSERLSEINQLASISPDTTVMAIRGGYGLQRLLSGIDWQGIAKKIDQGLQICGHSDFTAFHLALLAKTQRSSLAGPMLNFDFAYFDETGTAQEPNSYMFDHFKRASQQRQQMCAVEEKQVYLGKNKDTVEIKGMLWGGNLTMVNTLIGSEYFPSNQQYQNGILFLEDINEQPYRIERMLMQLLEAGILERQSAILLGQFTNYRLFETDRGYDLHSALSAIRQRLAPHIPMITGLPFGHVQKKTTLAVGAQAIIQVNPQGFELNSKW